MNLRGGGLKGERGKGEKIKLYFNKRGRDLFLAVLRAAMVIINVLLASDKDLFIVQCQDAP